MYKRQVHAVVDAEVAGSVELAFRKFLLKQTLPLLLTSTITRPLFRLPGGELVFLFDVLTARDVPGYDADFAATSDREGAETRAILGPFASFTLGLAAQFVGDGRHAWVFLVLPFGVHVAGAALAQTSPPQPSLKARLRRQPTPHLVALKNGSPCRGTIAELSKGESVTAR